jgi:hypothetical protein
MSDNNKNLISERVKICPYFINPPIFAVTWLQPTHASSSYPVCIKVVFLLLTLFMMTPTTKAAATSLLSVPHGHSSQQIQLLLIPFPSHFPTHRRTLPATKPTPSIIPSNLLNFTSTSKFEFNKFSAYLAHHILLGSCNAAFTKVQDLVRRVNWRLLIFLIFVGKVSFILMAPESTKEVIVTTTASVGRLATRRGLIIHGSIKIDSNY